MNGRDKIPIMYVPMGDHRRKGRAFCSASESGDRIIREHCQTYSHRSRNFRPTDLVVRKQF